MTSQPGKRFSSHSRGGKSPLEMTAFDRHVLHFVLTWAPFAGPSDDDAFPEFGLSACQLKERFTEIVRHAETRLPAFGEWDAGLIRRAQRELSRGEFP